MLFKIIGFIVVLLLYVGTMVISWKKNLLSKEGRVISVIISLALVVGLVVMYLLNSNLSLS